MTDKQWICCGDGEGKEVTGPGGWVQVRGKEWEWEWVCGNGKWINNNGVWVWVKSE